MTSNGSSGAPDSLSPLESYVNARMGKPVLRRIEWQQRSHGFPAPLGKLVRRMLWKWPYRHMRSYPWPAQMAPTRPGAWRISANGNTIDTVPLSEWIGPIDRPVTIVAGGPSAREHPIGDLTSGGRLVVAVNGVPAFLAEHGIRPDLWIVSDLRLAAQIEANFPHAAGTPLAVPAHVAAALVARAPTELARRPVCLVERVNQWHGVRSLDSEALSDLNARSGSPFSFPAQGGGKSVVGWSRRPELGFFSGCTVVFAALQIVIGLGARDIEIIGMDLGGSGHAYGKGANLIPSNLSADYEQRILPSFELMHQALVDSGVIVRNLSPVCPLPGHFFTA